MRTAYDAWALALPSAASGVDTRRSAHNGETP